MPRSSLINVPTPAPVIGSDAGDDAQHFGKREGHQSEVRAAQAGTKNQRTKHAAKSGTGQQSPPQSQTMR